MALSFSIYKDKAGEWRWRLKAGNNEIIASGEGYKQRESAEHTVNVIKEGAAGATVKFEDD